jgi:hypothetical protein
MPNRSWFYASNGQQQGPYPDNQLRELIARGTVTADTLLWSEGMTGWQRAGEIPGLFGGASRPPAVPRPGVPQAAAGSYAGGPLSIDFEILEFTWRSLALFVGFIFIIPAPWVLVWYLKWLVPRVSVPGRPNLNFEGNATTIAAWFFGVVILAVLVGLTGVKLLGNLMFLVEIALYWLLVKWFVANISSNGEPLELRFTGSPWGFIGYSVLAGIAILTIVGWAWVYVAQLRWMCRHVEGTRHEVVFNATGLEFLWRSLVMFVACLFIIPIPWMYRWFAQWLASQTVLVERGTQANA